MSIPRSSLQLLRSLASKQPITFPSVLGKRTLHMTGPTSYPPLPPQSLTSSHRPTTEPTTPHTESTTINTPTKTSISTTTSPTTNPHSFNTSADSSPVDLACLPDLVLENAEYTGEKSISAPGRQLRVPILDGDSSRLMEVGDVAEKEEKVEIVLKPQINTASGAGTHIQTPSGLADVHDNTSIAFEDLQSRPEKGLQSRADKIVDGIIEEESGILKQLWRGFMDDGVAGKGRELKS